MVYFSNLAKVPNAFQHLTGKVEYLISSFAPDTRLAIDMANLQPGEPVLDLGTGAGEVLATAKTSIQGGLCVGIDAVQGFLDVGVPTHLARSRLTVAPAGKDTQKGYLVKGSVADGTLPNPIPACTGQPAQFDVIFAIHIFNTLPLLQRRQTLQTWTRLLAHGGRIIISMSARFGPKQ